MYRSAFVFILSARADGELIDNIQAVLMMKLSLAVVWISAIQKWVLSLPLCRFYFTSNQEVDSEEEIHVVKSKAENMYVDLKKNQPFFKFLYSFLVKESIDNSTADTERLI